MIIPFSYHISVLLSLGGLGCGSLVFVYYLYKMSTDKLLAFRGDKDASNHLLLPCYRPVFILLASMFAILFGLVAVFYYLASVPKTIGTNSLMVLILFTATCIQFLCCVSPLLLWVKSLSRGGFQMIGKIIVSGLCCSIAVLVSLLVVGNSNARFGLLIALIALPGVPSVCLSAGLLSRRLSSRVALGSASSRSSSEFLLAYSAAVACFGALCIASESSSVGIIGVGGAVFANAFLPLALFRTFSADTKFWRGLGRHNQGGIGSSSLSASVDAAGHGEAAVTLRVASTHLQAVMADLSSLMIDFGYIDIGAVIGTGASSTVYKAEYKQKKVAIKVLTPPEITEEELASIREEVCINSILSHPCIVEVIGICVRPPEIGIVMEYCLKGTLKKSLHTDPLEWTALRRLRAMADLARAVAHVHEKGFMHRDIKAENLFVTDKWNVKLGDFGESRSILDVDQRQPEEQERQSAQLVQRMTVLGTVAYMAPELVSAQKQYTEAIDVYAMGITYWEIWTGKDPFAKENTFSIYQLIAQGARPELPASCPAGCAEVIRAAWHANAQERPSALAVVGRLDSVILLLQAATDSSASHEALPPSFFHFSTKACAPDTKKGKKRCNAAVNQEQRNHASKTNGIAADVSFQYDDTYSSSCDPAIDSASETHANPLKLLFR